MEKITQVYECRFNKSSAPIKTHVFRATDVKEAVLASLKLAQSMSQRMSLSIPVGRIYDLSVGVYVVGKVENGVLEHTDYPPFYEWNVFHPQFYGWSVFQKTIPSSRSLQEEYDYVKTLEQQTTFTGFQPCPLDVPPPAEYYKVGDVPHLVTQPEDKHAKLMLVFLPKLDDWSIGWYLGGARDEWRIQGSNNDWEVSHFAPLPLIPEMDATQPCPLCGHVRSQH